MGSALYAYRSSLELANVLFSDNSTSYDVFEDPECIGVTVADNSCRRCSRPAPSATTT